MIGKVNHIGIAVRDIGRSIELYRDVLGLKLISVEDVPEQKVRVAVFDAGATHIELLEPLGEGSPIARFLEKRGEGIHHIALETDDILGEMKRLRERGMEFIYEEPQKRLNHYLITFINPKSAGRVLIELCQPLNER